MNLQDPEYQHKSKSIASPEQNYFAHFAMRYPVRKDIGVVGGPENVNFPLLYVVKMSLHR